MTEVWSSQFLGQLSLVSPGSLNPASNSFGWSKGGRREDHGYRVIPHGMWFPVAVKWFTRTAISVPLPLPSKTFNSPTYSNAESKRQIFPPICCLTLEHVLHPQAIYIIYVGSNVGSNTRYAWLSLVIYQQLTICRMLSADWAWADRQLLITD